MYFLFAWRYFKAKKSTNVINIISWVCITAIVVGTAALILVLSVFNGFEGLVKSLYASFYPDLKLSAAQGKFMRLTAEQLKQLRGMAGIRNFSLVVEEKALIQNGGNQSLVQLMGVDENFSTVNTIKHQIFSGKFDLGDAQAPRLVLGAGIEAALGVRSGAQTDPLLIYMPRKTAGEQLNGLEDIGSDTIRAAGSFLIQQDFDNKYAITPISFLRKAMSLPEDQYSSVQIAVSDPAAADRVAAVLRQQFGKEYKVQNRYQQNESLYAVMNLERWMFYAVLSLILVVAAFNMVGALTMLVLEKQKDISVLNALGADQRFVRRIFLSEGFLLALIGGGIGMLLALVLALLQLHFHLIPLQGGSFLINYFPVSLRLSDFLLVGGTVTIIAFLASWIPAMKASRQSFSLRSE
ncbi:FtsX-like permease family protein [Niabella terrae]